MFSVRHCCSIPSMCSPPHFIRSPPCAIQRRKLLEAPSFSALQSYWHWACKEKTNKLRRANFRSKLHNLTVVFYNDGFGICSSFGGGVFMDGGEGDIPPICFARERSQDSQQYVCTHLGLRKWRSMLVLPPGCRSLCIHHLALLCIQWV